MKKKIEMKLTSEELSRIRGLIGAAVVAAYQRSATAHFNGKPDEGKNASDYAESLEAIERKIRYAVSRQKASDL